MAPAMSNPLMDSNHRLDDGFLDKGNFKVTVKNTFIDINENVPGAAALSRLKTEPVKKGARTGIEGVEDSDDEDFSNPSNIQPEKDQQNLQMQKKAPVSPAADVVLPPGPPEFPHHTTVAAYEPGTVTSSYMQPAPSSQAPLLYPQHPREQLPTCNGEAWWANGGYSRTDEKLVPTFDTGQRHMPWQETLRQDVASIIGGGGRYMPANLLPTEFVPQANAGQQCWAAGNALVLPNEQPEPDELSDKDEWEVIGELPQRFQPQSMSQWRNMKTGSICIYWTVDAKKLRSNDRLTVSPLFKLSDGHVNAAQLPFKMTVTPKVISDGKGGASFRKAKGKATIQLKCEAPRDEGEMEGYPIRFYLSAWNGREQDSMALPMRGPVTCNFAQSGICGLPKDNEIWNFPEVVDQASQTFVICLEVLAP